MKNKSALLVAGFFLLTAFRLFAQCDLELTATISNPLPSIYTNVDYTFTLVNKGDETAVNIIVKAPDFLSLTASSGLVYTGVQASQGEWDIFRNNWQIPALAKNETATLTLTLFTMKQVIPAVFAQVRAASPFDSDSQPGNNSGIVPHEDDEVLVAGSGSACDLQLAFVDTMCLPLPNPYFEVNYGYQLKAVTNDPDIEFVRISTDPNFTSSWIVEPGQVSDQIRSYSFEPVHYYAYPLNNPGCVVHDSIVPPPGCYTAPQPGECLINYFYLDKVYCLNNGANYTLQIDLSAYGHTGMNGLQPTDYFSVFLDSVYAGSGMVSAPLTLGLSNELPMPAGNVHYRIVRNQDQKCIAQGEFRPANYCTDPGIHPCYQTSGFPWHEWIKRVQIDGLDHTSGKATYNDFRSGLNMPGSLVAYVHAGQTIPITVEVGYSWMTYDEYFRIYLDLNRNGALGADELVWEGILPAPPAGPNVSATLVANLVIPPNAVEGWSTLKIAMQRGAYPDPCAPVAFGEVEYYSVSILDGAPSTNPCHQMELTILGTECLDAGSVDQPIDDLYYIHYRVDLPGAEGQPVYTYAYRGHIADPLSRPPFLPGFQYGGIVGVDTVYGPVSIHDYPDLIFNASTALPTGPACQAQPVLVFAPQTCSNGPTPTAQPHCTASSDFPWQDWIAKVNIGTYEKSSGKSPYSDFTNEVIPLTHGSTLVSLTTGYSWQTYDEYWRIWIDFNQDGLLETPAEVAFEGVLAKPVDGVPKKTLDGQLNVPASALPGLTQARVIMRRYFYGHPCGTIQYGEVEDYTVDIAQSLAPGALRQAIPPAAAPPEIRLYPNPASDYLFVHLPDWSGQPATISMYNPLGIKILSKQVDQMSASPEVLDLSGIPNGHYFLKMETPGERAVFGKLVVVRRD